MKKPVVSMKQVDESLGSAMKALRKAVDEFTDILVTADNEKWSPKVRKLIYELWDIVFDTEWEVEQKLKAFRKQKQKGEELDWKLKRWEKKALALKAAYDAANGQLTPELKQAIENIIAYLPENSGDE